MAYKFENILNVNRVKITVRTQDVTECNYNLEKIEKLSPGLNKYIADDDIKIPISHYTTSRTGLQIDSSIIGLSHVSTVNELFVLDQHKLFKLIRNLNFVDNIPDNSQVYFPTFLGFSRKLFKEFFKTRNISIVRDINKADVVIFDFAEFTKEFLGRINDKYNQSISSIYYPSKTLVKISENDITHSDCHNSLCTRNNEDINLRNLKDLLVLDYANFNLSRDGMHSRRQDFLSKGIVRMNIFDKESPTYELMKLLFIINSKKIIALNTVNDIISEKNTINFKRFLQYNDMLLSNDKTVKDMALEMISVSSIESVFYIILLFKLHSEYIFKYSSVKNKNFFKNCIKILEDKYGYKVISFIKNPDLSSSYKAFIKTAKNDFNFFDHPSFFSKITDLCDMLSSHKHLKHLVEMPFKVNKEFFYRCLRNILNNYGVGLKDSVSVIGELDVTNICDVNNFKFNPNIILEDE